MCSYYAMQRTEFGGNGGGTDLYLALNILVLSRSVPGKYLIDSI